MDLRLTPGDIDALASRVADLLRDRPLPTLIDVAGAAALLNVSCDYVRQHAAELGGIRLPSSGDRTIWRFDPERLPGRAADQQPSAPTLLDSRRRQRQPRTHLLPIGGGDAA